MNTKMETAEAAAMADRLRDAYNAHDAKGLGQLFANDGTLRDLAWGDAFTGGEAITASYQAEFNASKDIHMEELARFVSASALAFELQVTGTHTGPWRGLPATGNRFDLRAWTIMTLDSSGQRIVEVRFNYDRARVLEKLGLLHDLNSTLGKAVIALSHPVTMARAAARRISDRPPAPQA